MSFPGVGAGGRDSVVHSRAPRALQGTCFVPQASSPLYNQILLMFDISSTVRYVASGVAMVLGGCTSSAMTSCDKRRYSWSCLRPSLAPGSWLCGMEVYGSSAWSALFKLCLADSYEGWDLVGTVIELLLTERFGAAAVPSAFADTAAATGERPTALQLDLYSQIRTGTFRSCAFKVMSDVVHISFSIRLAGDTLS